jgi:EAL and modified HD-GYP domain-containing signal transduction protein
MHSQCLVRQPLFGASGRLIGYEIRFRDEIDGREAFSQSVLSGTFDLVRGPHPAFVSCSRAQLLDNVFHATDPTTVVLLLPRDLEPDADVQAALRAWRTAGGTFAIDDLVEAPSPAEALLPEAAWARVDVRCEELDGLRRVRDRVAASRHARCIADHVYDPEQYELTITLGFDAFMGAYFSRPEPLPASDLPASSVAAMRLLGQARDAQVPDRVLEDAIATDPVLTFQLLRLVNSASVGARGVTSIGQALRLIGRDAFLRWLALAIAASRKASTDVDQELVRQAVERGRLLEQLAGGGRESGTLFLVGMFSLMDAIFRMPIAEILGRVALGEAAREALLDRTGPYADAIALAEAYELGLFESAAELAAGMGVDPATVGTKYATAVAWAAEALAPMMGATPARRPALAVA